MKECCGNQECAEEEMEEMDKCCDDPDCCDGSVSDEGVCNDGVCDEECSCCSDDALKEVENQLRDLINLVAVYKEEEKQDVTTKIDPATAEELVAKLKDLAKAMGFVCS
ncbi:MAG: hypothetical protein KKA62_06190 [Nanoarchaeota archaeon]|nr:hypothetical protein [Nanoarchaeota archaeon]MBU1644181.1 hypothetical protein [Nanoarchaeota archaeon]MBU1977514.1 hypothetical protein [Nanoarchaeota archaeon]